MKMVLLAYYLTKRRKVCIRIPFTASSYWRFDMESLSLVAFVRFEIWALITALMLVVGYQLLAGRINTKKLLFDKTNNHRSPGRVQLLMLTLVGALSYLLMTVDDPKNLPEVPTELLLIMGGSNLVYLTGKASSSFPSLFQRKEKSDNQTKKRR
jgi:hypothetical protein